MKVNEIFRSIQGESSFSGLPCTMIRLTGCNLRCLYCDTPYAFYDGTDMTVEDALKEITRLTIGTRDEREEMNFKNSLPITEPALSLSKGHSSLVEITGGEPLIQEDVYLLIKGLLNTGYRVLIETNGSLDIGRLDSRVVRIMDIKTPKSGMSGNMDFENINKLGIKDEVKFVISDRDDYEWSKKVLGRYAIPCSILFSPAYGVLDPGILSDWILSDHLEVRLNLQLHKYIWGDKAVHR
ncbi:MAG: 7-carboxy-7-deazaguanine synthase [Nitrospirota bacterium]